MEWQELLLDGYERIWQIIERTLKGLSREDLDWRAKPDANSIGWLAWHLSRVQDGHVADLMGQEQLWISQKWHAKFGRPANATDSGFGHGVKELDAFKSPEAQIILDYHRAVLNRTEEYIRSLSAADLSRELNEPQYQPLPTVGVRLISVMSDNLQHAGQMSYVRGLLQGKGWFPY